jgi:hypothetical protein
MILLLPAMVLFTKQTDVMLQTNSVIDQDTLAKNVIMF